MRRKFRVSFLVIVGLVGLALRLAFLVATPVDKPAEIGALSSFNDERAHVEFTRHIVQFGSLPEHVRPITDDADTPQYENYQSPAYYLVHAAICVGLDLSSIRQLTLSGRALSVIFGLLLMCLAWKASAALGLSEISTAMVFTFVSLSGVFTRYSTVAGNDAMFWLLIGWFALALIKIEKVGHNHLLLVCAFLAFVLAVYTKLSALILIPALFFQLRRSRVPSRHVNLGFTLSFLALMPLFYRNLTVFGAAVPLETGFGLPAWRIPDWDDLLYLIRSFVFPWSELWSNWRGLTLMLPSLIIGFMMILKWLRARERVEWRAILAFTALAAYAFLNLRYDQAEARYLFAAWPFVFSLAGSVQSSFRLPAAFALSLCLPYLLFLY